MVGGSYKDRARHTQGFVAGETAGHWGKVREVPGLGALGTGRFAVVLSISCASAGNCAAGGLYANAGKSQGFVASERNGSWGKAIEPPGLGKLNAGGRGWVTSVSCGAPGSCAAGGFYTDSSGHGQAFVASQRNGSWGKAIEVPRPATLNARGSAAVGSLSCTSASECAAVGTYRDRSGHAQSFVAAKT